MNYFSLSGLAKHICDADQLFYIHSDQISPNILHF